MKLWKVTVNAFGWDRAKTLYFTDKDAACKAADRFPASDPVVYAGNCSDAAASAKLDYTDIVLNPCAW